MMNHLVRRNSVTANLLAEQRSLLRPASHVETTLQCFAQGLAERRDVTLRVSVAQVCRRVS